jgi:hypothetical protein
MAHYIKAPDRMGFSGSSPTVWDPTRGQSKGRLRVPLLHVTPTVRVETRASQKGPAAVANFEPMLATLVASLMAVALAF